MAGVHPKLLALSTLSPAFNSFLIVATLPLQQARFIALLILGAVVACCGTPLLLVMLLIHLHIEGEREREEEETQVSSIEEEGTVSVVKR
jgi:hypothetical protein